MKKVPHESIMLQEFLAFFAGRDIKVFIDGTLGAGGHTEAILKAHPEIEALIGFDQDPLALDIAEKRLEPWKDKLHLIHSNYSELDRVVKNLGYEKVDGFFLI